MGTTTASATPISVASGLSAASPSAPALTQALAAVVALVTRAVTGAPTAATGVVAGSAVARHASRECADLGCRQADLSGERGPAGAGATRSQQGSPDDATSTTAITHVVLVIAPQHARLGARRGNDRTHVLTGVLHCISPFGGPPQIVRKAGQWGWSIHPAQKG